MSKSILSTEKLSKNEKILEEEIISMLNNSNPLTGIYSIYGDYPIEEEEGERLLTKKLEAMNVVR